jgi:hypothetical protein
MEAKVLPKRMTAETMQMDRLTTIMNNIKVVITKGTNRTTMSTTIVVYLPTNSTKPISKMSMIWVTSVCQTIQIEATNTMVPSLNKKRRMRMKNH